jgi:flavodoxin/Pyruvate/2-oxoacid:ferredoxin oxidoreductase delta subunit
MQSAGIYYFSGTGNTEFVARLIAVNLESSGLAVDITPTDFLAMPSLAGHDVAFLGFPIHGFGAPSVVLDFIGRLPHGEGQRVVLFCTYGGATLGAQVRVGNILLSRGYEPAGFCGVRMPHNNPAGTSMSTQPVDRLARRARVKIAAFCSQIAELHDTVSGFSITSATIGERLNRYFVTHDRPTFARAAFADDSCVRCGSCADLCPVDGIRLDADKVVFGPECIGCLRCFNNCPHHAIQSRGTTADSERYRGPLGDYAVPLRYPPLQLLRS